MKPVVGITPSLDNEGQLHRPGYYLYRGYSDAVVHFDLTPLVLPILAPELLDSTLDDTLQALDGLVLSGGQDIDASSYGESSREPGDILRMQYERALLARAIQMQIPILGICLGLQTINVAFGGTLHQHIPDAYPTSTIVHEGGGDEYKHAITIEPQSLLARCAGGDVGRVNSYHHQAVKDLGRGLRITARSEDGVPEAIEWAVPRRSFFLGVQWHPEREIRETVSRGVFEAFATDCRRWQAERESRGARAASARTSSGNGAATLQMNAGVGE